MSGCLTTGSEADPQTAAKGHSCFCDLPAGTPASDSQARLHTHSLPYKSSRGVRQCGMWQACPQSRLTREQAQRVATASPATPLVGHRGAGSSHGRGWRAHGRRRAGWACLLPCEELAGEGGSGNVAVGGGGGGSGGDGGDDGGGIRRWWWPWRRRSCSGVLRDASSAVGNSFSED